MPQLAKRFQTRMEVYQPDKGLISDMRIFFDYDRRRAALFDKHNNTEYRYIFDYANDEIHKIERK
jgi:hypothetical protein